MKRIAVIGDYSKNTLCGNSCVLAAVDKGNNAFQSSEKLKIENAYSEDAEGYLAAKEEKFKKIAKYNKTNHKKYNEHKPEKAAGINCGHFYNKKVLTAEAMRTHCFYSDKHINVNITPA